VYEQVFADGFDAVDSVSREFGHVPSIIERERAESPSGQLGTEHKGNAVDGIAFRHMTGC
jgi:hypothetical protein